jgi:ABC-2 type transport system permease protein
MGVVSRTAATAGVFLGELFRQPWLLFIVILGPFLILLAFVLGARVYRDFPRTIIVQPAAAAGDAPLQMGAQHLSNFLSVVDVTPDREAALGRLRRGEVALVLELPQDPMGALARGEQAQIRLTTNEIDPVAASFMTLYVESQIAELNRQAIARSAEQARASAGSVQGDVDRLAQALDGLESANVAEQRRRLAEAATLLGQLERALAQLEEPARALAGTLGGAALGEVRAQRERVARLQADVRALDNQLALAPSPAEAARIRQEIGQLQALLRQLRATDPNVLSAPFAATVENVAPFKPAGTSYFLPGILALVLQHFAVTLAAVSVARDRRLGMLDLYRLSPASAAEVLTGKYLGMGVMVALVAAAVTTGVVLWLGIPVLAGVGWLAAALAVFLLAALGLGFVVGLLTRSEDAAIQSAMILLIASVAFGGLLAPLDQLTAPLRAVAHLLPVTTGRILLEAAFFRGYVVDWIGPGVLAALAVVGVVLSYRLFGRELARRR